jgi:hypothetical protein
MAPPGIRRTAQKDAARQIWKAPAAPGFSTASQLTDIHRLAHAVCARSVSGLCSSSLPLPTSNPARHESPNSRNTGKPLVIPHTDRIGPAKRSYRYLGIWQIPHSEKTTWVGGARFLAYRLKRRNLRMIPLRQINAEIGIQIFRVAVDENEGVVEAQNSRAIVFAPRSCRSRAEERSSETLTANQHSANRSTTLTSLEFGAESRVLQKIERCPTVRKCKTGTRPSVVG